MSKKRIAVITGANGGFGKEFVKLIEKENDVSEIWAIARNGKRLEELSNEYKGKIQTFSMDLTERENLYKIKKELENRDVSIKYLVNNAGFAKFCSYDDISVEESLNMIDLNVSAVVALGLICIPYMERNSYIINIASQSAFSPLPYQNLYSSTKAFVRNYTRALNVELKEKEIHTIAVCPGWMKTALFERSLIGAKKASNNFSGMVTPDVVAAKAFEDVKKGKDISVYGFWVKFTHVLSKILPQRLMMKIWLNQQKLK